MGSSPLLSLFLPVASGCLILTCAVPPAPDLDITTAQPEITINPPHDAQTMDTVGNQISIKIKLRLSGLLDSFDIVVKGKSAAGEDTIEKTQKISPDDFVGDSILISYMPLTVGPKTVSVAAYFPNTTAKTADYALDVVTYIPSVTITPPLNAQTVDTAGDVVTFGITHTHAGFLDSLVVKVKDSSTSAVEWVFRFTAFDSSRTDALVTLASPGNKILVATGYYENGACVADTTRFPVAAVTKPGERTPPLVRITAPADSDSIHVSAMPLRIAGIALDSSDIASVTYVKIKGSVRDSGTARGTTSWSIDNLTLDTGFTKIVVRALDGAGNVGTDTIRVRYVTAATGSAPIILSQPGNTQAAINEPVTFTVSATGSRPLTFTWKRGATALTGSDSTYRIAMAQTSDSGRYSCTVFGANGLSTACSTWTLHVGLAVVAPSITSDPKDSAVVEGRPVSFTVSASGTNLQYIWFRGLDSIPTARAATYSVTAASFADTGTYAVKVCNPKGCVTSKAARLTVMTSTFTIGATAGTHGSISPTGSVTVTSGSSKTFVITPDTGYHIAEVLVDDTASVTAKTAGAFTFSNVTVNHKISVTFAINTYKLTVTSLHGTVSTNPSTVNAVDHGTSVTVHARPDAGYYFSGWSGAVTSTDTPLVIVMKRDTSVTANFALIGRFSVNITSLNGSVAKSPDSASYLKNTRVKLTAVPNPGYTFIRWQGDAAATTDTVTITVDTTKNMTAVFAIKSYPLTIVASNGTVVTNPTGTSFDSNTVVVLTATPNPGYTFSGWSGGASGTNATTTVTMVSAKTVVASFDIKKYTLTTSTSANVGTVTGSVTLNPEATLYDTGTVVSLTPPVDSRYTFTGWSGSGATGTANPLTVTMSGNKTISANYTIKTYTLSINRTPTAGGNVVANPATGPYNQGTSVAVTATASSGYYFSTWSGDASGGTSPTSVLMDGNKSVTAIFAMNPPVITTHPSSHTILSGRIDSFTVAATGVSLSYQWQRYVAGNWTNITGATLTSYVLSPARDGDNAAQFRCVVTNTGGSVNSNAATLLVSPLGMKRIAGGTFQMGEVNVAEPVHSVTVSTFWMDSTEVTQADYLALMGNNPSRFQGTAGDENRPVENVMWYSAILYCNARSKARGLDTVYIHSGPSMDQGGLVTYVGLSVNYSANGYRLPTEAEWEYAAGPVPNFACYGQDQITGRTCTVVGGRLPNSLGLYDMLGNVWEWCNDWYAAYGNGPDSDPIGPTTGTYKVLRGTCWVSATLSRTVRALNYPSGTYDSSNMGSYGFRCVLRAW